MDDDFRATILVWIESLNAHVFRIANALERQAEAQELLAMATWEPRSAQSDAATALYNRIRARNE